MSWSKLPGAWRALVLALPVCLAAPQPVGAETLRERIAARLAERQTQRQGDELDGDEAGRRAELPAGVRVLRDIAYGPDRRQRFDVYLPAEARAQAGGMPVIFMVHGGAWAIGGKAMAAVVENKAARWVPAGMALVSIDYRMLPEADPVEQARDVARALAAAQARAAEWGGDPRRFVLMGHSAGAHLIALVGSDPALAAGAGPWLGSVLLDSAALDVEAIMNMRHLGLYDRAFGQDPAFWRAASPYRALARPAPPVLAVCSSRREAACPHARRYVDKATGLGMRAAVLPQDLTHRDINLQLGLPGAYTAAVEGFMASLDPALARALAVAAAPH
ncbi:alpha/beta hydrolase [Chitinimonas koreensis]|uniref:alpha/beta hydrolase n=1 Tax=Chitinimonas koreensis TaxID=356302 RepID=UPI0003FD35C9|nr:alpha/beta hydrolase [Chitinimonas koreensis]QNM95670.1 alpha/beta hydrolase [Chitinimonas koreensis]